MRMRTTAVAIVVALGLGTVATTATAHAGTPAKAKASAAASVKAKASGAAALKAKPVTGKLVGKIEYLAPGKIVVSPHGGNRDQALWLGYDTRVVDSLGVICDGKGRPLPYRCTIDELEKTLEANEYPVYATVTFTRGVADSIVGLIED
ncbi:hypothetical protein [Streptomyces clavuligerus]|uniref:Uncharacterized protein n=1 Tax=Streptomyces clavuligerus TaxID=1901 RepID=B5GWU9_STRCL|nr:hypothetical protein [Streptomyces clavuligerus]ANW16902.1 hypothetical protein BB341_01005 [Streptomyces clavuligerus]AXU11431.1 hypothetical protein D1794_01070 [Streptomyces clavuligerus]EDY50795.1 hypothetical protein SSCG_03475 [Streptomyces clavuligerus]EFG10575.1 Hypothetical protein SCLAV_5508 [Streptomyces clavuligerus]MBY6301249.1 hypothetical protein [Streptomyces clavuligerus]